MPRIEIVRDMSRFEAVAPAWDALWAASGRHIFQHHGWLLGWAGGVRGRRDFRLNIALAWDGDRLAGAMPCAVQRRAGVRVLTWAAQLFSDYCDCLLDQAGDPRALLAAMWDGLRQAGGFDLVSLQQVRPDAACRPFLAEGRPFRTGDRQERCMRIDNHWRDGAAFFRSLNKKARNNHTRGKRILAEAGGEPAFRVVGAGEDGTALFDEILRLKEAWLRATEPKSTLLGADRAVLRATLDGAWRTGLAKIFLLECGGRIAAASINFCYANRMEAYLTSYDAAFERASPGTILIVEYAQWSFDRGLAHVDFLRGEEAFKFRMANAETRLGSYEGARTLLGQVAMSGHRWLVRRRSVARAPEMEAAA
jgi:CelD/BcsL family acetyltransferase involved in cellulose biosynthesis